MIVDDCNHRHENQNSFSGIIVLLLVCLHVIVLKYAFLNHKEIYPLIIITFPLLIASAVYHRYQKKGVHDVPSSKLSNQLNDLK